MSLARRGLAFAVLLIGVAALGSASASAQDADPGPRDQVVLSGEVEVRRGEDVGEIVVLHGTVAVAGVAHGDVVVIDGDITVTGQVSGSVVSINGPVRIGPDAQVGGDVIARDRLEIGEGALIGGEVREGAAFTFRTPFAVFGRFAAWFAVASSALVLGTFLLLLAPRGAEAVALAARSAPWASFGWGLAVSFGLPIVGVVAVLSLVGLPLGLGVVLALLLLYSMGFVWSAFALGRVIRREPRNAWLAFLIGWVCLVAVAAIPLVGGFVWFAGAVYGLGAASVATWRARNTGGRHRVSARVLVTERSMGEEGTGI